MYCLLICDLCNAQPASLWFLQPKYLFLSQPDVQLANDKAKIAMAITVFTYDYTVNSNDN